MKSEAARDLALIYQTGESGSITPVRRAWRADRARQRPSFEPSCRSALSARSDARHRESTCRRTKLDRFAAPTGWIRRRRHWTFLDDAPTAAGASRCRSPPADRPLVSTVDDPCPSTRMLLDKGFARPREHPVSARRVELMTSTADGRAEAGAPSCSRPWRELGHGRECHAPHRLFTTPGDFILGMGLWTPRTWIRRGHGRSADDPAP